MPTQQRARSDDGGDLFEPLQTDFLGLGGQSSALVVVEPGLLAQLLPEDQDLLLEVFDRVLLIAVDPAGQTDEEQLKLVHPGRIGGGRQFGQEFCYGEAYTCVDRRILVSSKRKREFLDSTGTESAANSPHIMHRDSVEVSSATDWSGTSLTKSKAVLNL